MKKIFTLIAAAVICMAAQAQTITINKADGTQVVYNASEVSSIEYAPDGGESEDLTLIHSFTGWLMVKSAYFTDTYYGDKAVVSVYQNAAGETLIKFEDEQWGTGWFTVDGTHGEISGEGVISMNGHSGLKEYAADISGTNTKFEISLPSVMGGTVVTWTYGDAPVGYIVAGNYKVSSKGASTYFQDYNPQGQDAVSVSADEGGETVTVVYDNEAWGKATFAGITPAVNSDGSYTLKGEGTWSMAMNGGEAKDYAADLDVTVKDGQLSGSCTAPSVMGGLSIVFAEPYEETESAE